MKTLTKIKAVVTGAAIALSAHGVSAAPYFDFGPLAETITNFTPVLEALGVLIPVFLVVIIPLVILGVVATGLVVGSWALLSMLNVTQWMKLSGGKGRGRT